MTHTPSHSRKLLKLGRSEPSLMSGRRAFLRRFGTGWLVVLIGGCGKTSSVSFQNIGSLKLLEEEGKIFSEHFSSDPLLVIRGPKKKNSAEIGVLSAVSPICSHQKCLVNWDNVQESFICPCHQSRFDITGKRLQGPAPKNLKTYSVEVRGDDIWVADRLQQNS